MADCTLWDISTGVKSTWAANAALVALIPAASVYFGRAGERTGHPYAVYTFENVEAEYFSGPAYLKKFRLEIGVFAKATWGDWASAAAALLEAFGWTASDPNGPSWTVPHATVISSKFADEGFELQDWRVDGEDLMKHTTAFDVILECNRGV